MDEIILKITAIVKLFLKNNDFVVKLALETDNTLEFVLVSSSKNIALLTDKKNSGSKSFFEQLVNMMQFIVKDHKIQKKVIILSEVLYERKR